MYVYMILDYVLGIPRVFIFYAIIQVAADASVGMEQVDFIELQGFSLLTDQRAIYVYTKEAP